MSLRLHHTNTISRLKKFQPHMATFHFNFNTLLLQQQPLPHLNLISLPLYPFHHSYLSFSLSLNLNTTFQPHASSIPNSYTSTNTIKTIISERVEKNKIKDNEYVVEKKNKSNKMRKDSPEMRLRVAFDMCSKNGDAIGALSLYDLTRKEGVVKLGLHHYTVLLYLCSSAAFGVVKPAKSGSGARTLNALVSPCSEVFNHEEQSGTVDRKNTSFSNGIGTFDNAEELNSLSNSIEKLDKREEVNPFNQEDNGTLMSEDVKKYALQRGFEVYENMCLDKVQMNEAALTSVARMAMSMGDGDMAFEMVKQMKNLGISPRLRSYGPALWTFCNNGDIDKAFEVEKNMLENGVYPEEPELEALLRVSIGASKGDKVYYVLHKLRSSVRKVSLSTAYLIIDWFKCKHASRIGKRKWDKRLMKEAMENNGGGWHGQGWLGRGKWEISHTTIGNNGICKCCGVHLTTIDLDLIETENFAKSLASFAIMREKKSNFEKFQKWLDSYGPFDAVVDAANVGLFGQRVFNPSKASY
ncbi:putative ribonuclease P [Lupinus albus]|uniref:ribonuclease P n=1 Tax=Lupinus albus TaxID=3870 RepID=A0A6A4P6Y0_LUPAL|nr:putative ribonuclease P [Lupinus albus]